ncbi:MAG TPA: F0F1 ATP synthase subunit A [Candidatus Saccharimonadia bacterium]|jgi:F-type H+-transporting ATPase subunit a
MMLLATAVLNVSVGAEHVLNLGPIQINNSQMLGLVGWALTFWLLVRTVRRVRTKRYDRLTTAVLWAYEYLLDTTTEVLGSRERAQKLAPIAISMFFFIIVNNWLEVLPILGPVTWHGTQLFRGLSADMNFTFALAVITFATAHIWAIRDRGFIGNMKRYVHNPLKDPVHAFEGFLEIVAEISRFLALSLRLFGNIFGGEVLLLVISFITVYASVLALPPFLLFEIFIGLIQAYIFFMLTIVFVSLGTVSDTAPASPETESLELEAAT